MNIANSICGVDPEIRERWGRYVLRRVENPAADLVLQRMLVDPDELFFQGAAVDNGRFDVRRDCVYITITGQD